MAGVGTIVYGSDYNAVYTKVRQVLGDGYPYGPLMYGSNLNFGWGRPMVSNLVNPSDLIDDQQWINLITDINTAYLHVSGSGISLSLGTPISFSNLNILDGYANNLLANKNSIHYTQKVQDAVSSTGQSTFGSVWGQGGSSYITSYAHVYFNSDAEMQYFFNQGGSIDIQGLGPGSSTQQDASWSSLLSSVALTIDLAQFSGMSTSAMNRIGNIYTASNPTYGANTVEIAGIRFQNFLAFRIIMRDGHAAQGGSSADYVNGGCGYQIRWTRSSGVYNGIIPDAYAGQFVLDNNTNKGGFSGSSGPIPQFDSNGAVFNHNITKNIQNYDLYKMTTAHGGGCNTANLNLRGGVYLWSNRTSDPALNFTGVGGTINLLNEGYIMGKGGNGGAAYSDETGASGLPGRNGGTGIQLNAVNVNINNTNGYILGGGGGGGGAGYGTVGGGDYHYGGGGGGAGAGQGGEGYSSADYLGSAIMISPAGISSSNNFKPPDPGAAGQNGGVGAQAPAGGDGGRVPLYPNNIAGPSGTTLTSGYGGQQGGSGGIWGGPLSNLAATGGSGGSLIVGTSNSGGNGSSTVGNPGSIGTGGGGSWGAAGGAGTYSGGNNVAGGNGGFAISTQGRTVNWTGGAPGSGRVQGSVA